MTVQTPFPYKAEWKLHGSLWSKENSFHNNVGNFSLVCSADMLNSHTSALNKQRHIWLCFKYVTQDFVDKIE